jgi:hypothetical protein
MSDNSTDVDLINNNFKSLAIDGSESNNENRLTGGFLPIVECNMNKLVSEEANKDRHFKSKQNTISIKDIMKKRRSTSSLFNISSRK